MKFVKSLPLACAAALAVLCNCSDILKKNDDQKVDAPPPAPIDLTVSYDTAHGCVLLTWKAVRVSDEAGYIIYRDDPSSSNPLRLNDSLVTDTLYRDTLFRNPTDTVERIVTYSLKTQDKAAHESEEFSDPVTIIALPPSALRTSISMKIINGSGDSARVGDMVSIAASYRNAGRQIVALQWFVGRKDSLVKTVLDTAYRGGDTIALSWPDTSLKRVYIAITDRSSAVWWDSATVFIMRDMPVVNAGKDTGVWINDTVHVHGTETQRFGSVAAWAWKLGWGSWVTCGGPDTFFIVPDAEGPLSCSLAVTDDYGNRSFDEKIVTVYQHLLAVSAGWDHTVLFKADSTVWTCGHNHDGQLGDGTNTDRLIPVKVMTGARAVIAGFFQTMVIKSDNSLWACGLCQIGPGGPTPVKVLANVRSAAIGGSHTLVLKTDGSVWACGDNSHYQLGIVSQNPVTTPTHVMDSVQSIAAGNNHSLALKTNNTLWAWGQNWNGQCGNGKTLETAIYPVQVLNGVQAIGAGSSHSLALKTDGTLWACGINQQGQLGNATTIDTSLFVQVASGVHSIAAGINNTFFLKTDGSLWACGYNTSGQLGDATTANQPVPVRIMDAIQSFVPVYTHSLFLKTDGTLWACGDNTYGQFGDSTLTPRKTPGRILPPLR